MKSQIIVVYDNDTVRYAAKELEKYGKMMMPELMQEILTTNESCSHPSIKLGLFSDFGISTDGIEDLQWDDAIYIDIDGLNGIISGTNPWSVLFAVYRFLESRGCRWIRHGQDGEIVPLIDLSCGKVKLEEKASCRHRGLCIEGAVSFENMLDNIEWAPKAGYNSYFIEFFVPFTFFDRYYKHINNSQKEEEQVTVEQVANFKKRMEVEIKKRGLRYHAIGHAFTCEAMGLPGYGWDTSEYVVSDDTKKMMAQLNGKRDLFENTPLLTNLCYSNAEVRKKIVDFTVDYMEASDFVDVLEFWLADGSNNHCECEECNKARPSDFYVMILNQIDEELTKRSINTKVAFIVYEDTLYAPIKEKIKNPDRFILNSGIITRTYSEKYSDQYKNIKPDAYIKNKSVYPTSVAENVALVKEWERAFTGDIYAYEYYFMWDNYFDPGYYSMAEFLCEDIKGLKSIGINGLISDQSQRSFFPTGLGMFVMGRTLWDTSINFKEISEYYLKASFGENWMLCRDYLKELSYLFDAEYLRGEKRSSFERDTNTRDFNMWPLKPDRRVIDKDILDKLKLIPGVINDFIPIISRSMFNSDKCVAFSWKYLEYHAKICLDFSKGLIAREEKDFESAQRQWKKVVDFVEKNEDYLQSVFDVFEFISVMKNKFD